MTTTADSVLSDALLKRIEDRAADSDRDNKFFDEDFKELKEAGFLLACVPKELGGLGLNLAQVGAEQRRLAYHSAPTALGVNMHFYWTGLAADVWRSGDMSTEWMLKAAADGDIFAAGHGEIGAELPLLLSTTNAEKVDGGYKFTGRKSFGSLTPVWTYLGLHGMDTSDPDAPKIVHAFMPRDSSGYTIHDVWDTVGMRATQSQDTVLDGAFIPDKYIVRAVDAGFGGVDLFVLSIFAWALMGFANVYYGNAQHALDLTIESVKNKKSLALTRSMAYHPEVQHAIAEMVVDMEGVEAHLDRVTQDWSDGVDHGGAWALKLTAAKLHAAEGTWKVVDAAMDLQGGFSIFKAGGFERLWRDARLVKIHPSNKALTMEIVGKISLGIGLDEAPRWG
ncbi:MAG: acyl-CoA/acyl-ACP dehydrogenase [Chloroflexi bacterium]|nr:acyl-CoA/acyl-ACP dehydrogenase [Chloroflexota bacterium]